MEAWRYIPQKITFSIDGGVHVHAPAALFCQQYQFNREAVKRGAGQDFVKTVKYPALPAVDPRFFDSSNRILVSTRTAY